MRPIFLTAACLALASPAAAATISAATDAQLIAAVKAAKPGDRIELAPGSYALFTDKAHDFGPAGLMITSADPAHPATVAGFSLTGWKAATISNLVVANAYALGGGFNLVGGANILLDHLDFNGGGAKGTALGISGGCVGCVVQNSLIHDFGGGIALNGTQLTPYPNATSIPNPGPVTIQNNEFYSLTGDGVHGVYSNRTTIAHNSFHDFADPGDGSHPDAIQFENLPYGTHYAMDDEVVTDNWIYQGATAYGMQGVFLHGGQDAGQVLNRAIIERNTICVATQFNGVYLTGGVDFSVRDNYVVGPMSMKVVVSQGLRGVVSGNTANTLALSYTDPSVVIGQNTAAPAVSDCTVAAAHAVATGAGAGPRATLGPQAPVKATTAPPAPDLAPVVADLTAKLAAANAQVAAMTQQLADARAAGAAAASASSTANLQMQAAISVANDAKDALAKATADRDALQKKIDAYIAAKAALGF